MLVVDDDPAMLEVLTRILRRENYDLLTAGDGAEALEKARAAKDLALLVTDYDMPGLTGNELADQVREMYPGSKILFQSGFSDLLFTEDGSLGEGVAFLRKPFTARSLREAARMVAVRNAQSLRTCDPRIRQFRQPRVRRWQVLADRGKPTAGTDLPVVLRGVPIHQKALRVER